MRGQDSQKILQPVAVGRALWAACGQHFLASQRSGSVGAGAPARGCVCTSRSLLAATFSKISRSPSSPWHLAHLTLKSVLSRVQNASGYSIVQVLVGHRVGSSVRLSPALPAAPVAPESTQHDVGQWPQHIFGHWFTSNERTSGE